jgi:hypothetical protein
MRRAEARVATAGGDLEQKRAELLGQRDVPAPLERDDRAKLRRGQKVVVVQAPRAEARDARADVVDRGARTSRWCA